MCVFLDKIYIESKSFPKFGHRVDSTAEGCCFASLSSSPRSSVRNSDGWRKLCCLEMIQLGIRVRPLLVDVNQHWWGSMHAGVDVVDAFYFSGSPFSFLSLLKYHLYLGMCKHSQELLPSVQLIDINVDVVITSFFPQGPERLPIFYCLKYKSTAHTFIQLKVYFPLKFIFKPSIS